MEGRGCNTKACFAMHCLQEHMYFSTSLFKLNVLLDLFVLLALLCLAFLIKQNNWFYCVCHPDNQKQLWFYGVCHRNRRAIVKTYWLFNVCHRNIKTNKNKTQKNTDIINIKKHKHKRESNKT